MIAVATKTTKPKKVSKLADIELKISTAIITSYLRLGELLHEAKTSRIYKPLTFKMWIRSHPEWEFGSNRAYQYIQFYELNRQLAAHNCVQIPNEAMARELLKLPDPVGWWKDRTSSRNPLTGEQVPKTASQLRDAVLQFTKNVKGKTRPVVSPKAYQLSIELSDNHADTFETIREILGESVTVNKIGTRLCLVGAPEEIGKALAAIGNILGTLQAHTGHWKEI